MAGRSFWIVLAVCGIIGTSTVTAYVHTPSVAGPEGKEPEQTEPLVVFILEKDEYQFDDKIKIVMKNVGNRTLHTPTGPVGFTIYDQHNDYVCKGKVGQDEEAALHPGRNVTETWEQSSDTCGDRQAGTYELRADHFRSFNPGEMPVREITILPEN